MREALRARPAARTEAPYYQSIARAVAGNRERQGEENGRAVAADFLRLTDRLREDAGPFPPAEEAARRLGLALALHALGMRRPALAQLWASVRATPADLLRRPRRARLIAPLIVPPSWTGLIKRALRRGAFEPQPNVELPVAVKEVAESPEV